MHPDLDAVELSKHHIYPDLRRTVHTSQQYHIRLPYRFELTCLLTAVDTVFLSAVTAGEVVCLFTQSRVCAKAEGK